MSYQDVSTYYPAAHHAALLIEDAGLATIDRNSLSSYDNWLLTVATQSEKDNPRNIALYDQMADGDYTQDNSLWALDSLTVRMIFRHREYLSAYTMAVKVRAYLDQNFRSVFYFWDATQQATAPASWEVEYRYNGMIYERGPADGGHDENWRPQVEMEYRCMRQIIQINNI